MVKILKGCSIRMDGSMYLSPDGFSMENLKNRKKFFANRRLLDTNIIAANLVHGNKVVVVDDSSPGFVLGVDALVTHESDICLTVTGADCFPVYFENKKTGTVGLAHCGWRGILDDIVKNVIRTMTGNGENPQDIYVTFGPGICKHHFEIQAKDIELFGEYPESILKNNEKVFVNLKKIMMMQLRKNGILQKHVTDTKECTYCLPHKYFSFRRDKPKNLETQVAYIIKKS